MLSHKEDTGYFLFMKQLVIKEFKGSKTVKSNKGLSSNVFFSSKTKDFAGKLSHSHYALKFPIRGTENYIINNHKYKIDNNNYFVANAGEEIEAYVKSDKEVIGICIGFTKNYLSNLAVSIDQKLEAGIDNPFVTGNSINFISKKNRIDNDALSRTLNKIKLDLSKNKVVQYEDEHFYISLGEILINKEIKTYSDIERLPHIKLSSRQEIYRRICLMNDYIHDNYKNDITLDDLSQTCSLSKFHALRCYQKIFNITPYRKILMLRLEEAKFLISSGMSVSEVAYEINFSDHRAFSKLFKMYFQMTPSQFKAGRLKH